jgi:hypothetical protein
VNLRYLWCCLHTTQQRPFLAYYGTRCLIWELYVPCYIHFCCPHGSSRSTPFLNIHWFLDKTGKTGTKLQLFNGALLLSTFAGTRLIWGTLVVSSGTLLCVALGNRHASLNAPICAVISVLQHVVQRAGASSPRISPRVRCRKRRPQSSQLVLVCTAIPLLVRSKQTPIFSSTLCIPQHPPSR